MYDYIGNGYLKDKFNYCNDINKTENIINSVLFNINGQERFSEQKMSYYNLIEPLKYHKSSSKGIGVYSFSVNVNDYQYAGYCNFSKIADAELKLKLNKSVSSNRPVQFRLYTMSLRKIIINKGIVTLI